MTTTVADDIHVKYSQWNHQVSHGTAEVKKTHLLYSPSQAANKGS